MTIGPLEIVLIIVVIFAVALAVRITRSGLVKRGLACKLSKPPFSRLGLRPLGIALMAIGILALAFTGGLFRMVLQGYFWALLITTIGLAILRLSHRRS